MISFRTLNSKEYSDYVLWRKNHGCTSTIEFIIKPDQVDQSTTVRCHKCGEEKDITDWDAA